LLVGIFSIFALDFQFQLLYVDLPIGLLFAAALALVILGDDLSTDRFVTILLISIALTLLKPYGIIFGLICWFLVFFKFAYKNATLRSFKSFWGSVFKPLLNIKILLLLMEQPFRPVQ
jgi:hypothetical protein